MNTTSTALTLLREIYDDVIQGAIPNLDDPWWAAASAAFAAPAQAVAPNNDEVICPNCVHQFRAIPANVQRLMLDAGFVPPFTQPAAPAQAGDWSLGLMAGNWIEIDHGDHHGVMRIVWKMGGDTRSPVCEARALGVVAALNAARGAAQATPVDAEPLWRTDAEIVEQTEILARYLLSWKWGLQPESPDIQLRNCQNTKAQKAWNAACEIQDLLTATDVENAVAEVDDARAAYDFRDAAGEEED